MPSRRSGQNAIGSLLEDDMAAPAHAHTGNLQIRDFLGFLKFRPKEERWQLVDGIAMMMNPPALVHQIIAMNLALLLEESLRRKGLNHLALIEIGVRIPGVANFLPRPDVVIIPEVLVDAVYADRILLVTEVLSPSNTKRLIAQKLRHYKEHPENLYCLMIDSKRPWMQVYPRAGNWEPATLDEPADVLELPEFGLRCTLGDLYRRTPIDPGRSTKQARPR
jgi:Uma2 family endonuclease